MESRIGSCTVSCLDLGLDTAGPQGTSNFLDSAGVCHLNFSFQMPDNQWTSFHMRFNYSKGSARAPEHRRHYWPLGCMPGFV